MWLTILIQKTCVCLKQIITLKLSFANSKTRLRSLSDAKDVCTPCEQSEIYSEDNKICENCEAGKIPVQGGTECSSCPPGTKEG